MRKFVAIVVLFLVAPGAWAHITYPKQGEVYTKEYNPDPKFDGFASVYHNPSEACTVTGELVELVVGTPLLGIRSTKQPALDIEFYLHPIRPPENGDETTAVNLRWRATGLNTFGVPDPECNGGNDYYFRVQIKTKAACAKDRARELPASSDGCPTSPSLVLEFYNASLDHYFITWAGDEVATLFEGTQIKGWATTGYSFLTNTDAQDGTSPVCRFYIPPALGDSHFFGRGTAECDATAQKNPSFILEDPAFMQMYLPNLGACPAGTMPIDRVFNNRADANHRYLTDKAERDRMVAKGWIAEGDGPDRVVMCAPQ